MDLETNRKNLYENCILCPRKCGVNRRTETTGIEGAADQRGADRTPDSLDPQVRTGWCGLDDRIRIARAALHFWEEPELSGEAGSGTVFFAGCNLKCVYCQNHEISGFRTDRLKRSDSLSCSSEYGISSSKDLMLSDHGRFRTVSVDELADIFLDLQKQGALNINLVTAVMYMPDVLDALDMAKARGLAIPVVYNSSGYESVELLKMMEGYIDIYLPDLKYLDPVLSGRLSGVPDYPEIACAAIAEMVRQTRTIVRHLVLPGHTTESKRVIEYLYKIYGDDITISIMSQYTPVARIPEDLHELNRRITRREYDKVVDHAISIGVTNAYIQDRVVADESFIPKWG